MALLEGKKNLCEYFIHILQFIKLKNMQTLCYFCRPCKFGNPKEFADS